MNGRVTMGIDTGKNAKKGGGGKRKRQGNKVHLQYEAPE
jgi:hypothetical protein